MALPTLDEALDHLRFDLFDAPSEWREREIAYVQGLLDDATDFVAAYCQRKVYSTTAELESAVEDGTAGPAPMVAGGDVRRAVLMLIGAWNENREAVNVGNIVNEMPFGVKAILERYRKGLGV